MTALATPPAYELRPPERINLHGQETGRDHLSHSSIGTFLACQQKWNWSREHQLEPAVTAKPLAMGRAFAHALEHGDPDAGETSLRDEARAETERAAGSPWITAPDDREVDVQATVVREAARAYLAAYGTHDATREVELRARIRNPAQGGRYSLTHDIVCRLDALDAANAVLIENKLQGRIDRVNAPARLRLDRQVTIGTYLAWRCLGIEITEVRYRVTKKPGIRQTQKESFDDYLARIAQEYATKPDDYLSEEIVTRTPDDFLRLEQELWTWAESIRAARRSGVWPRNVAHCSDHGGCAYLSACSREPGWEHQFITRPEREATPAVAAVAPSVRESSHKEAA
ncbi:MAG TPA: PD-(D/E)XK nuclease family protein [Solirubrobacteraceae bacterium]|nr:PD-(D/E)XK nuclease family protein [Solirubrobacteraceae bacterium]